MLLKRNLTEKEQLGAVDKIMLSNVSAKVRKELILNLNKRNRAFEWAVADFINKNYKFTDVFRGTSKCADLEELSNIISQNIEEEFADFDKRELLSIIYYICRIEHEKYPDNIAIEQLRINYLREKVMEWN